MGAKRKQRDEEVADAARAETVCETATEEKDESAASNGEDFEMRIVVRSTNAPPPRQQQQPPRSDEDDEDAKSASGDDADVSIDGAVPEKADDNKCSKCSSRKAKSCANNACKRCCSRLGTECAVHSKPPEPKKKKESGGDSSSVVDAPTLRKTRKPVLKNEFRESSVQYYDETATLFCLRDFFHLKKVSQPLLNDQTRNLRVKSVNKTPPVVKEGGNPELKATILRALKGVAA